MLHLKRCRKDINKSLSITDLKNKEASSLSTATAKSLQSCPTLCDPVDCSPLGSSVHGLFQARILPWVAISSSRMQTRSAEPLDPEHERD